MKTVIKRSHSTTWVNNETHCIARFSKGGYEIFSASLRSGAAPLEAQVARNTNAGPWLWSLFARALYEWHGVSISHDDAPDYLRFSAAVADCA